MKTSKVKLRDKEYILEFFSGRELKNISSEKQLEIVKCYMEVFNESWQENWTIEAAQNEIESSFRISEKRIPILSLLWHEKELAGFAWGCLTDADNLLAEKDMPFYLTTEKKEECLRITKYWLKTIVKQYKVLIFHEFGAKKKFRNSVSSFNGLSILSYALEHGCKSLVYWTSEKSNMFRLGLSLGWYPIHFCIDNDIILMGGNVELSIQNTEYLIKENISANSIMWLYRQNATRFI